MRTFDENSCALSITNPRSFSPPNFAPEPINFRGGDGRSLLERSDSTIGGGSPESRDFPRDSGDSLNKGGGGGGGLTLKATEKLQLYRLYVYYVVHICDFGMLRVNECPSVGFKTSLDLNFFLVLVLSYVQSLWDFAFVPGLDVSTSSWSRTQHWNVHLKVL